MMVELPEGYAEKQRRYTSNSRGCRTGERVIQNVRECAQYLEAPVVCIGCGDGLEVEYLALNLCIAPSKENILGIEVAKDRVVGAVARKLPVVEGIAENLPDIIYKQYGEDRKMNIYCAHTLEHCFALDLVIQNMKEVALNTIVIIVPIELSGKSPNVVHYNPIADLGQIVNKFGINWKVAVLAYRWNMELEGLLVLKRDPTNWPQGYKKQSIDLFNSI